MRRMIPGLLVFLVACGGAKKEAPGANTGPSGSAYDTQTKPVWEEDVEDAAYKFYRSVSKTLLRTHQHMRASQTIRRLFKLKPNDPEPYYLMGRAYVGLEQFDSAEKMFLKSTEKDEDYAPAYSMLGMVLNMTGQHKRAVECHKKAIDLDDTNASFYNNLGFGWYLQGRNKEAIAAYQEALERDPGARRTHNNLGFAYGKTGELDKAYSHFKMAGAQAQADNNMGFVHEERGELEKAYHYYVIALEQNPNLLQAQKNLERICDQMGRPMPDVGIKYNTEPEVDVETSTLDSSEGG